MLEHRPHHAHQVTPEGPQGLVVGLSLRTLLVVEGFGLWNGGGILRLSEAFLSIMADRLAQLGERLVSLMRKQKVGLV